MNGKPITKSQADAIRKILTGENSTTKPTRNGKAKKPVRKATAEESEMLWIIIAAAIIFFALYQYRTGQI